MDSNWKATFLLQCIGRSINVIFITWVNSHNLKQNKTKQKNCKAGRSITTFNEKWSVILNPQNVLLPVWSCFCAVSHCDNKQCPMFRPFKESIKLQCVCVLYFSGSYILQRYLPKSETARSPRNWVQKVILRTSNYFWRPIKQERSPSFSATDIPVFGW